MDDFLKSILKKISSYDIFTNLFPGIVFCSIVEKTTRFSFSTENILEKIFFYYFIGMTLSRIGSIFIENFTKYISYDDYIEASKNDSLIKILSEKNSIYRTVCAMLVVIFCVELYDSFLYDLFNNLTITANNLVFFIILFLIIILFLYSYKKQTNYVRKRVNNYIQSKRNS